MKKICLMFFFLSVFTTSTLALEQGQFKITTGVDLNNIAWGYTSDFEKVSFSGSNILYRIPFNLEYGIIKDLDVRFMMNYMMFNERNPSFGQPGIGAKYMFWILGASFDVWLPLAAGKLFPGTDKRTKIDLSLYVEPTLGKVKIDFLFNMFLETGGYIDDEHVMTISVKPWYDLPDSSLSIACGLQLDYIFYPNDDSSIVGDILLSLVPTLKLKLSSKTELALEIPVSLTGKNYILPGDYYHASSPYNLSGYGIRTYVSMIF